jgi:hypothetical protein
VRFTAFAVTNVAILGQARPPKKYSERRFAI